MKKAYCLIRSQPHYRLEAFEAGLRAAGYEIGGQVLDVKPGDVLVTWNRYGTSDAIAASFERAGGLVLVAENGYLGRDDQGRQLYAIAAHAHNGRGWWPVGDALRWDMLGVRMRPWRSAGDHVLVCPNRSFGMPGGIMPSHWAEDVERRLKTFTRRPVRVRPHPGNHAPVKPLAEDLLSAWAVVIWSSSAGVHALVSGVPVICEAPWWICKPASSPSVADVDKLKSPPQIRTPAMQRLAWAQWTVDEIASGHPFKLNWRK